MKEEIIQPLLRFSEAQALLLLVMAVDKPLFDIDSVPIMKFIAAHRKQLASAKKEIERAIGVVCND